MMIRDLCLQSDLKHEDWMDMFNQIDKMNLIYHFIFVVGCLVSLFIHSFVLFSSQCLG